MDISSTVKELQAKLEEAQQTVEALEKAIAALAELDSASPRQHRVTRADNNEINSLKVAVAFAETLKGSPFHIKQLAAEFVRHGYQRGTANATMSSFKDRFERVGKGIYRLKASETA